MQPLSRASAAHMFIAERLISFLEKANRDGALV
jgi:hypothetical protein